MGRKENIKKEIFLDILPRHKINRLEGCINWKESIGCKVKFIYDDIEGEVEIVDYVTKNQTLIIVYKDKVRYKIKSCLFQKCQLGKLLRKYTNEFKIEIGQVFKDDKRDLIITDRKYKKDKGGTEWKYYKYRCNKCGYDEGWTSEHRLLQGVGCACCVNQIVVKDINDIPTTDPWMVKYFQGGYDEAKMYTKCSGRKIKPICPDCGRIRDKEVTIADIYNRKSIGCSCGDGKPYPEKFMFNVLEQLEVEFETEFSPEWIGDKRYDFYISSKNIIIEMDGGLGHGKAVHSLSKKSAEETKADDDYKDMMAKEHSIEVIRINCDKSELEYIRDNILKSKLNNLFNLNNIDWNKCEEFALSNRVKEVCKLKRDNPCLTTTEIVKIMKSNPTTIIIYLKQGSKLGWCNYDPKEEMRKNGSRNGNKYMGACNNPKLVKIFKDGFLLGIFESVSELSRRSEELFGIKLTCSQISKVCNGKIKYYKGFTFKYIQ